MGLVTLALASPAWAQQVTKIASGDTIVVDGVGKVRLIGIRSIDESAFGVGNASVPPPRHDPPSPTSQPPTMVNGGIKLKPQRPSRDFLTGLLLGQTVTLQYDPLLGEKNGRLAYVFLPDGSLVNAEMLRQGKARVDLSHEFAHKEEFKRLAEEADTAGVGVRAGVPRP